MNKQLSVVDRARMIPRSDYSVVGEYEDCGYEIIRPVLLGSTEWVPDWILQKAKLEIWDDEGELHEFHDLTRDQLCDIIGVDAVCDMEEDYK